MSKQKKTPREFAVIPSEDNPPKRRGFPPSPDVDDSAVNAAEKELGTTDPRNRDRRVSQAPLRGRRKKEPPKVATVFVRGPEPVIDAFNRYKEEQGFVSNWAALEDLLHTSGVKIPDFDI